MTAIKDKGVLNMSIVLMGPRGVGKTKVSNILAEEFKINHISLDSLRIWKYRDEMNELGLFPLSEEGHAYVVERTVQDYSHQECILDFGYLHSLYKSEEAANKIKNLLQPFKNVILLLPSPEIKESEEILLQMNGQQMGVEQLEIINKENQKFLRNPYVETLVKQTVYTKDLSFEEVAERIKKVLV